MCTQEIKGNLARLLATENLIVEHRKTATAMFDVERRVLTLPLWDKASSTVYDMLVGHEVGHALFTPNEDWREVADCPKDFVNVIEDARIEKLMKRKFPGLRKSFAGGYKELNDMDFFGIDGEDLDTFSLIDRINLHFKIGASAMILSLLRSRYLLLALILQKLLKMSVRLLSMCTTFLRKRSRRDQAPQPQQGETESNDVEQSEQQSSEEQSIPNQTLKVVHLLQEQN